MKLHAVVLWGALSLAPVFTAQAEKEAAQVSQVSLGHAQFSGLTLQDGTTMEDSWFKGRYGVGYIGFTSCRTFCPMIQGKIPGILKALRQMKEESPVFFMLDIKGARPEAFGQYFQDHEMPDMIGLTGTTEQITASATQMKTFFDKNGVHDTLFAVVNPAGVVIKKIRSDLSVQEIADLVNHAIITDQSRNPVLSSPAP